MGTHNTHGFTLIELLIAMAMATVMFGALGVILVNVITVQSHSLQRQEVLQNVRVITETMSRYIRIAHPYTDTENGTQHTECVKENTHFGGLSTLQEYHPRARTRGMSATSYIQFLSPIPTQTPECVRFYLKDGTVWIGTHEEGAGDKQWNDFEITAQEDVSIKHLEIVQGGASGELGLAPFITILIEAGIERNGTYEYLVDTQVGVAVRNLVAYEPYELSDERAVSILKATRKTQQRGDGGIHGCWFDFELSVDVDAVRQAYQPLAVEDGGMYIPVIEVAGHQCENKMSLRIITEGFTKQELSDNEHTVNLLDIPTGTGLQVVQDANKLRNDLPCEAQFFAVRLHPLNKNVCQDNTFNSYGYKKNYWTPFVLKP